MSARAETSTTVGPLSDKSDAFEHYSMPQDEAETGNSWFHKPQDCLATAPELPKKTLPGLWAHLNLEFFLLHKSSLSQSVVFHVLATFPLPVFGFPRATQPLPFQPRCTPVLSPAPPLPSLHLLPRNSQAAGTPSPLHPQQCYCCCSSSQSSCCHWHLHHHYSTLGL
jgi:hypothetical protein